MRPNVQNGDVWIFLMFGSCMLALYAKNLQLYTSLLHAFATVLSKLKLPHFQLSALIVCAYSTL